MCWYYLNIWGGLFKLGNLEQKEKENSLHVKHLARNFRCSSCHTVVFPKHMGRIYNLGNSKQKEKEYLA